MDSHCPFAEEYSFLSLFSAATLFTSLALNAAKPSIPFGRIKRPPKAWWSAKVEDPVSERRKTFTDAHRSDEYRQPYISASRRALMSLPRPRLRHGRRLALLSRPNQTLNLYTFSFALLLALLPHLPPLLTSLTVPLLKRWLRSSPITYDHTFLSPSPMSCVAEPKATFLSSAEPLNCPFAQPFPSLNFLRLHPTFPPPLLLAQTKLPIPC